MNTKDLIAFLQRFDGDDIAVEISYPDNYNQERITREIVNITVEFSPDGCVTYIRLEAE